MASSILNIIDSSATTFKDLFKFESLSFNNKTKSIAWDLPDSYINTRLLIDRIYMNNFECYVNTKRGNFILDSFENWIHMVFYEKRWHCINRTNALPFTGDVINRQDIDVNYVEDQGFGENVLLTPTISANNGNYGKYHISNKLFVSAPRFISTLPGQNGVGAVYVYDGTTMAIEDMITIPYYYYLGVNQGNFGTHTAVLEMKNFGFDYLIVGATTRKSLTTDSLLSIYIFSYSKKTDGTSFYFHNETFGNKEIVVDTTKTLRDIKTVDNSSFILVFDDEIIKYNILNNASQSVIVSSAIKISSGSLVADSSLTIRSLDTVDNFAYILYSDSQVYRFNATSDPSTLINLGPVLSYSNLKTFKLADVQGQTGKQIIAESDSNLLFFNQNNNTPYRTLDFSANLVSYNVKGKETVMIDGTNITYQDGTSTPVRKQITSFLPNETASSKNKVILIGSDRFYTSGFTSGKIYQCRHQSQTINQFGNVSAPANLILDASGSYTDNQPEIILLSEDSEIMYAFNKTTKLISQFNRNSNNDYEFVQTIIPSESLKKELGYRDTIHDVKLDVGNLSLFIGFVPFGLNQVGRVVGVNLSSIVVEIKFTGTTPSFGKSIDISKTGQYVLVGEPDVPIETMNAITYKRGAVHLYNAVRPDVARYNVLRSSQFPVGNLVKFSPTENEFLSIGSKSTLNEVTQVVCFTNIFEKIYRSCVLKFDVTDAIYLEDGHLVLSANQLVNGKQTYYKSQKINGCFEVNTLKEITIPEITNVSGLKVNALGDRYAFFHSLDGTVTLMDIKTMKKIHQFTTNINTNITHAVDGTAFAHGYKRNGKLLVSFYA
jgi:hypothetical protein